MAKKSEYSCLREAYCARTGCRPDRFARKAFWKCLHRHALIPALLVGGSSNARFFHDMECLNALGEAQTLDDFNRALDELVGLQEVDRSRLRRFLAVRVAALRVRLIFQPYMAFVRPAAQAPAELPASPAPGTPTQRTAPAPASPTSRPDRWADADERLAGPRVPEPGSQQVRLLLRVHAAITSGTPIPVACESEGLDPSKLVDLVEASARQRPELAWLLAHLREREELETLRLQLRPAGKSQAG